MCSGSRKPKRGLLLSRLRMDASNFTPLFCAAQALPLVSDQESPQATFQKVPWGRQNAATCNIPYTPHETDQLSTESALYLEGLSSSPFVMLSNSSSSMPIQTPMVASAGSTRVQEGASPQGHKRAEAHLDELHQLGNDALHFGWRLGCC